MAKKKKDAAPKEPAPELQEIPLSTAPLPLLQLDARALAEFLELTFSDRRLLELCAELRLYSPGYRMDAMPPDQVAQMLAAEARNAKDAAALLQTRTSPRSVPGFALPAAVAVTNDVA